MYSFTYNGKCTFLNNLIEFQQLKRKICCFETKSMQEHYLVIELPNYEIQLLKFIKRKETIFQIKFRYQYITIFSYFLKGL